MKTILNHPFGLGDFAYYLFRPFVYIIDLVWGTDMRHCEKCKERRILWNSFGSVPRWVAILALAVFALVVA